jgi:hypothetical protein
MRLRIIAVAAVAALAFYATGHRIAVPAPPNPTTLILNMRSQAQPLRFSLGTEPEPPRCGAPITLRVQVSDAAGQAVDGLKIEVNASMSGADHEARQITLRGKGQGNYEGRVTLEAAGSWDLDLVATKDGRRARERISVEVGVAQEGTRSRNDEEDDT